jgi:uncharacterized protein YdaU (DUF1376 family)
MKQTQPKRKRSSWFAFYVDDYIGGTRVMSLSARGAFIDLLAYQFANDGIPDDERMICRIIGAFEDEWKWIREEVLSKFPACDDGVRRNCRMTKEREEREEIREKRVEASQKGNQKRWQNDLKSIPNGIANGIPNGNVLRIATTTTTTDKSKDLSKANKSPLSFPDSFSENRKQTFLLWAKHKAEKGQSYKPSGWKEMLTKLASMSDEALDQAVRHSMAMNYQGIFAGPKGEVQHQAAESKPKKLPIPANWREIAATIYDEPLTCEEDELTDDQRADIYRNSR